MKDYYNDLKKYVYKIKKKAKRYVRVIKKFFDNLFLNIKEYFLDFKEYLLRGENRKRNLVTLGTFIVLNLLLLISVPSFAIYQNNYEFSVLGGQVGDKYLDDFDYTLKVFAEDTNHDGSGNGKYNLISDIPSFGYTYSGYSCENGSTLTYDEETKMTSVTTEQKEICSIYFDLTADSDVVVRVMLEDNPDSETYSLGTKIPYYGYTYSHYECDNFSTLTYDSELHSVSVSTNSKEYCSIYFQKEAVDIEINLYVEETYEKGDYIERLSIPSNIVYTLNEEKSECFNKNNERIETDISYTDGNVVISSGEITYCKVYLDRANE